jgi:hypothetical protein
VGAADGAFVGVKHLLSVFWLGCRFEVRVGRCCLLSNGSLTVAPWVAWGTSCRGSVGAVVGAGGGFGCSPRKYANKVASKLSNRAFMVALRASLDTFAASFAAFMDSFASFRD